MGAMNKDKFKYVVGSVMLLAFLVIVHALSYRIIPEANRDILIHTIGIIEGGVMMQMNFYFGSSSGSQAKTEIIAKQSETISNT
jgi:hypothetical protein